ncbi:hypothetical protein WR25_11667 [Diploscapter pachys]|uniref:Uncharacterized protein n=1 Tax=Diploscapter pachys TaxID=2018661 RepID=A0A2A2M5Q3_9BILA|nr:hypothetical protein WR25_11667 [Diploscapter pachys]
MSCTCWANCPTSSALPATPLANASMAVTVACTCSRPRRAIWSDSREASEATGRVLSDRAQFFGSRGQLVGRV